MKSCLSLFSAFLLALSSGFAQRETATPSWLENLHLSASGTFGQTGNISRTSNEATRKDAETYELSLNSTHSRQLSRNLLLIASAELSTLAVPDYELTNHNRLGGRLTLQRKFGLGPQATVLQLTASAGYKDARLAADRGWTTEAGLQLSKRVLPNLRLVANASWLEHSARRDTFDLGQESYSAEVHWDISDRWSLSGSAGRLSGDIVANASWPVWSTMLAGGFGPTILNYYTSRPWTTTHLYGEGWVSYNVEADVDLWSVSLGFSVSDRTSLELRRSAAYVVNRVGVTYPTDSWSVGLSHRF
ncbi:hypothetical protein ESB00_07680 [Oleiharenicola lentus]|uniref:DUF481 domain-containing protein n=1 Tax=Oleiharenicola lentus TaxID=2508720 RepID=A0A4Q1C9R8_9BACT|nr:hypothetical protein [Oleiharenicola lentus]RXK55755.1 hypothetical protein ESB00_07680 [Oleiharenicola lentus]